MNLEAAIASVRALVGYMPEILVGVIVGALLLKSGPTLRRALKACEAPRGVTKAGESRDLLKPEEKGYLKAQVISRRFKYGDGKDAA